MPVFCETPELMFRPIYRVLCDSCPVPVADVGVSFGQTFENEPAMLESLAEMWRGNKIRHVAVTGFSGIPGFQSSSDQLCEKLECLGVAPDAIVCYPLSTALPPSTDAEAIGFAEYAKEKWNWGSAVIVVPELHRFRAFVSLVSAVVKAGTGLKVYSYATLPQDWNESVHFSQSVPPGPRRDQLLPEIRKVQRYCAKGDYLTAQELLDYLDSRDS